MTVTSSKPTVVLASANPDKIAELRAVIGNRFTIVARPDGLPDTIEDAETLEANAIKKALEVAQATGKWALADDTGLFVAALGDEPGVRTARYAGDQATSADNVAKLLRTLGDNDDRRAEFRTVIALITPDGSGVTGEGTVAGRISRVPRGRAGFGYDPIFIPDEGDGRSFAEMSPAEKNEISHRSRAVTSLEMALEYFPA